MKALGLVLSFSLLAAAVAAGQVVNPHGREDIGTVQQVYDGTLLSDIQVNTLRNTDRLFPTRVVTHGSRVYPLPASDKPLKSVRITADGHDNDL